MEHTGIIQPTFRSLSSSSGVESDVEEEEVDQLDSDTEEEAPPPAAGPAAPPTKTRPKVQVERVPGKSFIPLSKIETLLQADGEESFMSKEAVFAVAVATEEFVKRLMEVGRRSAQSSKRAMVNYRDVASATHHYPQFSFLHDTIPQPVSLAEALQLRAKREKELLEEPMIVSALPVSAPSLAPSLAPSDSPSGTPDDTPLPASRARGKGKEAAQPHPNGSVNGDEHASASTEPKRTRRSRKRQQEEDGPSAPVKEVEVVPMHPHRTRRRSSRSQRGVDIADLVDPSPPPHTNGHSPATNWRSASYRSSRLSNEWGSMAPPSSHSMDYDDEELYPPSEYRPEETWTPAPHFTGPASGYLDDHRMLFGGRNGMTSNPGRTIYNPHRQPNR